jgi:glycine reductase
MPVAKMVGSNRVIQGNGIVHPLGNPDLPPEEEKALRERILRQAFESLQKEAGA